MKTKHHIRFFVKGDIVAGDLTINRENIECENIEEMVELTYKDYKEALRYVWKRLEGDIKCQPRPHESFSITCFQTNENSFNYDENVVLDAFFKKRIHEHQKMGPIVGAVPR